MKKFVAICLLCAMSTSVLTSCGKPNLEGKWTLCNAKGEELDYSIRFKDDGTVKIDDEKGKYEVVDKDTIKIINIYGEKYEFDFEIIDEDEQLIYMGEFSDQIERNAINSWASTLRNAANAAITEIDEEDIYYKDKAVICSDSDKNINPVPENARADFDFVQDFVKPFFNIVDDYEYIIYIEDNVCQYTAIKNPSGDIIGTYPADEFEDMTFDEIYDELKGRIE